MPHPLAKLLLTKAYKFFELLILHMQYCRVGMSDVYCENVKETVFNLLAFDPSQPDDVDQMALYLAKGCKPSFKQRT